MPILANKAPELPPLIGEAPAFRASLAQVSALAPLDRPVLVVGERGTGKELVAARLTYLSPRWDRPFVKLNCAALAESLLDSELFGHEAGAFTGATRRRLSRFEIADGGTLFLDEIANASLAVQEKILRVIEYGSFERVGGNEVQRVDVRVIAATNVDLPALAEKGRFRSDLLDRLAFDVVTIPPLRERAEDIPELARHLMMRAAEAARVPLRVFGEDAMAALQAYEWPGNVRQLRNAIDWVLIMTPSDAREPIRADNLPPEITTLAPAVVKWDKGGELMGLPLRDAREMFEREYLMAQVTRFGGNISRTAAFVGMERSALHRKLKSLGVGGNGAGANGDRVQKLDA